MHEFQNRHNFYQNQQQQLSDEYMNMYYSSIINELTLCYPSLNQNQ